MKRVALVFVVSMLAAPLAAYGALAAEPWLRTGFDPGRTGAIPFEGPATNDTAFQVRLPGIPIEDTLLVDGDAYVATVDTGRFDFEGNTSGLDTRALWRIELSTGEVSKVVDLPEGEFEGVFGDVLLVEEGQDLVAYEVPSGAERWRATVRPDDPEVRSRFYGSGAVTKGSTIYIQFSTKRGGPEPARDEELGGVMAVDRASGEIRWATDRLEWRMNLTQQDPQREQEPERGVYSQGQGFVLAADGDRVYVYAQISDYDDAPPEVTVASRWRVEDEIWGLDADDGRALWMRNDTARDRWEVADQPLPVADYRGGLFCCARPVVTPTAVYTRLDAFQALNKRDGSTIWESPAGRKDQVDIMGSFGMGVHGDALIAASPQTVYRLQTSPQGLDWLKTDPDPEKVYGTQSVAIDADTAYVKTIRFHEEYGAPGVEARDLDGGGLLWDWHHQPSVGRPGSNLRIPNTPAFGPGVMVQGAKDGTVTVLGETGASLGDPRVEAPSYPAVGATVTLDVADVAPGAFGPATRYRVFWGDGNVSGWQSSPTFTHAYDEPGNVTARIQAANDANQTASTMQTFRVGQDPPEQLNLLQQAFSPRYADLTFGVLGIALALVGGAWGVARRRRKRTRLQDELEALGEGFEQTRDAPHECEAFLDQRKARARSLLMDGNLDQEQFGIVETRAEDLRRELRRRAVEEEFAFLPHALVVKAREMLDDGKVSTLEAEAFLAAIEEVEGLGDAQEALVRERIEDWFERDTAGG